MVESLKWAEFAMLAEGHRRAGMLDQAEQLARSGLAEHPDCAEGALVMALVLLDQNRDDEARRVLADWADTNLGVEVAGESTPVETSVTEVAGESTPVETSVTEVAGESAPVETFGTEVSDGELEVAFESAETDRDEVIDADRIAQQAVSETELDPADEFVSPDSSFATRTVADLLAEQGDEQRASQIRAMMDSSTRDTEVKNQDRNARKIERLERWLINIQGEAQ